MATISHRSRLKRSAQSWNNSKPYRCRPHHLVLPMLIFCLCIFHLILVEHLLGISLELGQQALPREVLSLKAFKSRMPFASAQWRPQNVQTSGLRAKTHGSRNAHRKPTTRASERGQFHNHHLVKLQGCRNLSKVPIRRKARLDLCRQRHMALILHGSTTKRPTSLSLIRPQWPEN